MKEDENWNCWTRNDRPIDGEHYLGIEGLSSVWSMGVHGFLEGVYLYSPRLKEFDSWPALQWVIYVIASDYL